MVHSRKNIAAVKQYTAGLDLTPATLLRPGIGEQPRLERGIG
jgi:hypothetical protein